MFACTYRSPRQRVYIDIRDHDNGSSKFQLVGETVAYKAADQGCSSGRCVGTFVESRSLRTGRQLQRIFGEPDRYVLKRNGSLAATVTINDIDPRLHLIKADRLGVQELAVDVDPGSLALATSRIYWTQGGTPQSAVLD